MRCKGCGYSLWNVPGRTCPECGRGFAPSEFEFRPNTVEFCCPGCMQQYYGTDKDGLPVPREFACVRCGAACTLDTMVLRLAPGATDDQTEVTRIPWERPGVGVFRRFWATAREGLVAPVSVGRAVASGADAWAAFRYCIVMLSVAAVPTGVAVIIAIAAFDGFGTAGARTGGSAWRSSVLETVGTVVLSTLGGIVGVLLAVTLAAALATVALRAMRAPAPWRVVWPAYAYSLGPMAFVAIPCLGPYCVSTVSVIWVLVAVTIALIAAVPNNVAKVVTATLVPPIAVVLLTGGVFAWVVVPAINQAAAAAAAAPAPLSAPSGAADPEAGETADGDEEPTGDMPGLPADGSAP
jgi:hypothetical protein